MVKIVSQQASLFLCLIFLNLVSGEVRAQSSVNVFGAIDLGVRYSTNQTIDGGKLIELAPGASATSNWGVSGKEYLGNGVAAIFTLDSSLNPDTGDADGSGVLFSRQSWVGVAGAFGQFTVGRQFTPLYNAEWAIEPFGWSNGYESAFIYSNYGGSINWDNSLMYSATIGDVTGVVMTGLGEQFGNAKAGRNFGASLAFANELATFNTAYQRVRNERAVIASEAWNVGGSVNLKPVKLFLGYLHHRSDLTPQKNDVFHTGFIYDIQPNLEFIGAYYHDKQRYAEGKKDTLSTMLSYKFSERTAIYIQADYSKIDAGYVTNIFDAYKFPSVSDSNGGVSSFVPTRTSLIVGVKYQF